MLIRYDGAKVDRCAGDDPHTCAAETVSGTPGFYFSRHVMHGPIEA